MLIESVAEFFLLYFNVICLQCVVFRINYLLLPLITMQCTVQERLVNSLIESEEIKETSINSLIYIILLELFMFFLFCVGFVVASGDTY